MGHSVWVKWKMRDSGDKWFEARVKDLPFNADVTGLRDWIAPGNPMLAAMVDVFEKAGGKQLGADIKLANYFIKKDAQEEEDDVNQKPGRSRAAALVMIVPEQHVSKRQKLVVEEKAFSPDLREYNSDMLVQLQVFERDDYVLTDPFHEEAFVGREEEKRFIRNQLLELAKATRNDKKNKFVVECATMSGAGKSRLMFNIFRGMKLQNLYGEELPVHVIRANFNGADGGRDLKGVADKNVEPEAAACRLLLTRGLLQCSPDTSCLGGLKVEDKKLPNPQEIKNAIFRKIFGDSNEKGIVVIHLDELGFLVEARKVYEDGNSPGSALRWVQQYIYSIVALSETASDRILVPVITHTSPLGRIFQSESLARAEYIPWKLHPFSLNGLWAIHDQNRKLKELEPVSEDIKDAWSACVALTGGNPSLFLDAFPYARDMLGYNSATEHFVILNLLNITAG